MQKTVYDVNKKPLFTGTKAEINGFLKRERLNRLQYEIGDPPVEIYTPEDQVEQSKQEFRVYTTSPKPSEPKGFFKRIFRR